MAAYGAGGVVPGLASRVGDRSFAVGSRGCMEWLRSRHSLDYPGPGCQEHGEVSESLAGEGASAIPSGGSRFYIAWFPEGWESGAHRVLVVTLHGSGGCAERMFSDAEGTYADLKAIFTSLEERCLLKGAVVLRGFSVARGARRHGYHPSV